MTDLTQAARQALEALEQSVDLVGNEYATNWRHGMPTRAAQLKALEDQWEAHKAAIAALRAALEAQQEPRPVALMWQHEETGRVTFTSMDDPYPGKRWHRVPLYAASQPAHPPAQPQGWVLVPEEPTREMCAAGVLALYEASAGDIETTASEVRITYSAMLAARPKETT